MMRHLTQYSDDYDQQLFDTNIVRKLQYTV
jgi:hypothetical protein